MSIINTTSPPTVGSEAEGQPLIEEVAPAPSTGWLRDFFVGTAYAQSLPVNNRKFTVRFVDPTVPSLKLRFLTASDSVLVSRTITHRNADSISVPPQAQHLVFTLGKRQLRAAIGSDTSLVVYQVVRRSKSELGFLHALGVRTKGDTEIRIERLAK